MKKNAAYLILAVVLCFLIIPFIINWLFEICTPISIFQAKWEASDALIYTAGVLSFIGTIFLGWISWKQNQTLQKKQDDTFIAENSCMVLIDSIQFMDMGQMQVNLDIHPETIVVTDSAVIADSILNIGSFKCIIELKHTKGYPVVVRVIEATLQTENKILTFKKYDDYFTKVAISEDVSWFQLTFITSRKEKNLIEPEILKGEGKIFLNIKMEIVSDKYVSTILTCRNKLHLKEDANKMVYVSDPKEIMSFWHGNSILISKLIRYRTET